MRARATWFDAIAILAALAAKFAQPPAAWIEAHYSNGAYPVIDRVLRALCGPLPFCVGDVLFFVAAGWLVRYWSARLRPASIVPVALRTAAVASVLYLWFLGSWAYNYARVPLADKIPVHANRTDAASVAALADHVVDELSRYAAAAHREPAGDARIGARLQPFFAATIARLGDTGAFAPPRVKPTIFQLALQLSGTTGFTDPWTHEVNLDSGALRIERPAIYAHEWAHVAGFADESEANFISVIACTTSRDPLFAYSGWLLVWSNLPPNVRVSHRISRLAFADLAAIRARYAKNVNPQVERASRAAYDTYLKSNRVAAGYGSYRLFVRWLTGADFDRAGLPLVRTPQ